MHENDRPSSPPKELRSDTSSMPTLREFWEELQRAKAAQDAPCLPGAGSGSRSGSRFGSGFGSGSGYGSGSGSGCGGYGIGLIAADDASQQRIRAIMRELCERDGEAR